MAETTELRKGENPCDTKGTVQEKTVPITSRPGTVDCPRDPQWVSFGNFEQL